MQNSNPASDETISNLIVNSGIAINDLYKSLKVELAVRSLMNDSTPLLYILTQDLQNGIRFILMDVSVSCRAEFSTSNLYEKRFHLKNIQASISEGYKLLFNFGKQRNKSLWMKLMIEVYNVCDDKLISKGLDIENKLIRFGASNIDKELRDLTLHYDKEMMEVYRKTSDISSEEIVIKKVCGFWALLQDILLFTEELDKYYLNQTGIVKPIITTPVELNVSSLHKIVCQIINREGTLDRLFEELSPTVIKGIDTMAIYWNSTKRIEGLIHSKLPDIDEVVEINYVQVLTNLQILMRFMMLDLASIVNAYIKSSSDIEFALNLRRVYVTKVSTMLHLYGYNDNEKNRSIWKQIVAIVPSNASILKDELNIISTQLSEIVVDSKDKYLRCKFVHLFDNSKGCGDISNIVQAIEEINPITQVAEITLLLRVYSVLINFITKLMATIASDAHEKVLLSSKQINDRFDEMIQKIIDAPLHEEQKESMIEKIKGLKAVWNKY
ncbi:MAG: hypothetical protein IJE43_12740 [Alphaproteobacteria bacterium]|nr:hypothetical protein [Alphaproteobacteria bacterium]MBQ3212472.1 hypothetical protein [Alistipes sp.]